ncbi:WhiB family transcriptional regulator [Nocardia brasiliensis]|uniref:WhiB family transcriptional regulator n=1 Tax=Nocardia brasiliensis TaxID=37326 RepID=UPI00142DCC31|nr:WhiB family transcriptional regulator [Nocardia brasiliensis]
MNNPYQATPSDEREDWRHRALCRDQPPERWSTDLLPKGHELREAAAAQRCAGCDVIAACAKFHLRRRATVGMVVAGIAVGGRNCTPASDTRRLEAVAAGRPVVVEPIREIKTEPCRRCGDPMATRTALSEARFPSGIREKDSYGRCRKCAQVIRYHAKKAAAVA